tara:strand:- start:2251 stop:9147 length:6897 start_codon:yes stop_codon:yes gene_type:complete
MKLTALELSQAGFDDDSIIGFIDEQRDMLTSAGFTHSEINKAYGLKVTKSPVISATDLLVDNSHIEPEVKPVGLNDSLLTQSIASGDQVIDTNTSDPIVNAKTSIKEAKANQITIDQINDAERRDLLAGMQKYKSLFKEEEGRVGLASEWLENYYPNISYEDAKTLEGNEFALIAQAESAQKRSYRTGRFNVAGKKYSREEFKTRFPSLYEADYEESKKEASKESGIEVINTLTTTQENSRTTLGWVADKYKLDAFGIANFNEAMSFIAAIESGNRSIYNAEGNKKGLWQLNEDQTLAATNNFVQMNWDTSGMDWQVPQWVSELYVHRDMTRLMPDQQRALAIANILGYNWKGGGPVSNGVDKDGDLLIKAIASGDKQAIVDAYITLHRSDIPFEVVDRKKTYKPSEELLARITEYTDQFDQTTYAYANPDIAVWASDGWLGNAVESIPVVGQNIIQWTGGRGHQNVFTNGYRLSMTGSIEAFNSALLDGEDPATVYRRIFMTQEQSFGKQVLQDFTMLMNDVPWYAAVGGACFVAGAATVGTAGTAGAALPLVCGGAAMALPDGMRDAYSRALQNNQVDNLDDFMSEYFDVKTAKVMAKSAVIGTTTVFTGIATKNFAGKYMGEGASTAARLGAETVAMTTMANLLEGQVPTLKDFAHSAILIGGVHGTFKLAGKSKSVYNVLHTLYSKYALHPRDINKIAEADPHFRQQLLDGQVPDLITDTATHLQTQMHQKAGIEPTNAHTSLKVDQVVETSRAGLEKGVITAIETAGNDVVLQVKIGKDGPVKPVLESQVQPVSSAKIKVVINEQSGKFVVSRVEPTAIERAQAEGRVSIDWQSIDVKLRTTSKPIEAVKSVEVDTTIVRVASEGATSNGIITVVNKMYPKVVEAFATSGKGKKVEPLVNKPSNNLDVINSTNNGKSYSAKSAKVVPIARLQAGELTKIDTIVLAIGKKIVSVPREPYDTLRNFTNETGREAGAKIVGQGNNVLFINPKTNKIMAVLKGEETTGPAKEQAQGFKTEKENGTMYDRENSRSDNNWQMPKDNYKENPIKLPETDNPVFALFNGSKGLDMMDLVAIVQKHMGKVPIMENMKDPNGRGYFQFNNKGNAKDTKIAIKKALAENPEHFLMTMAHEIGHMLDFIAKDSVTMKRGNILGSLASMKGFMNDWIDGKNDGAKPFSKIEIDALRKEAAEIARKDEPKIDAAINEAVGTSGLKITAQTILDIFKTTDARNKVDPLFYEAFVRMDSALKKLVIKDAVKGMIHSDLRALADRINAKDNPTAPKPTDLSAEGLAKAEKIFKERFEQSIKERGLVNKEWITQELKSLSMKWKPYNRVEGSKYTKYRDNPRELMADFLMAWLLRPQWLSLNAPRAYEMWAYHMSKKPELLAQWSKIQNDMAISGDSRISMAIKSIYDSNDVATARKIAALDKDKATVLSKRGQVADQLGYEVIDQFTWLYRRFRGENGQQRWHSTQAKDLQVRLENWRYRHAYQKRYNDDMIRDVVRPLEARNLSVKDLDVYLFLNNLAKSSQREGLANPLGVMSLTPELKLALKENGERSAEDMLAQLVNEKPYLVEAADNFYAHRARLVIPLMRESQMFDAETMKKIEDNKEYVTFSVVDYLVARLEKYGPNAIATKSLKKSQGTLSQIDSVFMATLEKDLVIIAEAKKMRLINDMVQWMQDNKSWMETFNKLKDKDGKIIKEDVIYYPKRVSATAFEAPALGMEAISWLANGKMKTVHIPKNLANAFFADPQGAMIIARTLEATAVPFKKIFTEYNPSFWAVNMGRDTTRAIRNLPKARYFDLAGGGKASYLKYLFKSFSPAAKSIWGDGTQLTRYMEENGFLISMEDGYRGQSGSMARLRNLSPDDIAIEQLLKKHVDAGTFQKMYDYSIGGFFKQLGNMARVTERMPKIAGLQYIKDQIARGEITMDEGQQMLTIQTEVGSPSFLRTGRLHWLTNNLMIYSNAANQGWRSDIVRAREDPKGVIGKYVAYTLAPKMLQKAAQYGALGSGVAYLYAGISDWDMTNYIVIPLGQVEATGQVIYIRVPQDESARLINGIFHKSIDAAIKEDPTKSGSEQLFDYISGSGYSMNPIFTFVPDVLKSIGGGIPYDDFTGKTAVDRTTATAGGDRKNLELSKWFWNAYGGQSIYKFKGRTEAEISSELQEILEVPVIGRGIARFIKIGEHPAMQEVRKTIKGYDHTQANITLDFQEALNMLLENNGDKMEPRHLQALALRNDQIRDHAIITRQLSTLGGADAFLSAWLEEKDTNKKVLMFDAFMRTTQKKDGGYPLDLFSNTE